MIVTRAEYRRLADDWTNYDGDVNEALVEAQAEAERITNRKFDLGERTESLELYNGRLYPSAVPTSVSSGGSVVGQAIDLGYWYYEWSNDWSQFSNGNMYNTITVTYTGGWTSETAPVELKRAISRLAKSRLTKPKTDFEGLPLETTSLSTGDLSWGGKSLRGAGTTDNSILADLYRWRRYQL